MINDFVITIDAPREKPIPSAVGTSYKRTTSTSKE